MVVATRASRAWERYAWSAGIVFVVAFVAETVVSTGVGVNQNDSAAKIANAMYDHRQRLLMITYLSVVYGREPGEENAGTPDAIGKPSVTARPIRSPQAGDPCRWRRRQKSLAAVAL